MLSADRRSEQLLGQDDAGSLPLISTVTAEADLLEPVAGRNDPRIIHGPRKAAAKIFKDGRVPCRLRDEVVEGFVAPGDDAGGRNVVAEYAAVHHLRKECSLRDELIQKMRNVLLAFGGEGLLIASAAAKGDDDGAGPRLNAGAEGRGRQCGDGRSRSGAGGEAQKFTAGVAAQFADARIEGIHRSSAIVRKVSLTLRCRVCPDKRHMSGHREGIANSNTVDPLPVLHVLGVHRGAT